MTLFDRRTMLFGGLCATSFAAAQFLTPSTPLRFLPGGRLEDIVPSSFGPWVSQYDPTLILPPSEDSLTDQLYDDLLMRRYSNTESGLEVFLLAAYGENQTDDLQLHRPEACYPAVGLPISQREDTSFKFGDRSIPAVALQSNMPNRVEDILYWSRIGEAFPRTAAEQRRDKLRLAMNGYAPDGMLVRVSNVRPSVDAPAMNLPSFVEDLLGHMKAPARKTMIA